MMSTSEKFLPYSIKITKLIFIFTIFSVVTLNIGCNEFDEVETDAELQPFFEIFAKEAAKRGFTVDYEAERIEGLLQDIFDSNIQGQCFRNEKKPKKVIIDTEYWARSTDLEKEFIIYHELGHCFLNRSHLNDGDSSGECVSIMHANPGVCNFLLTEENKSDYLDELFFQ